MAAIECDGERWHSGAEKVREDMERQTILERLGWRFIRIRGSEYYRAPEKTMERVISQLAAFGIEPEAAENSTIDKQHASELLSRVKLRAAQIIESRHDGEDPIDLETVRPPSTPSASSRSGSKKRAGLFRWCCRGWKSDGKQTGKAGNIPALPGFLGLLG